MLHVAVSCSCATDHGGVMGHCSCTLESAEYQIVNVAVFLQRVQAFLKALFAAFLSNELILGSIFWLDQSTQIFHVD